jgi:hypothetical protein
MNRSFRRLSWTLGPAVVLAIAFLALDAPATRAETRLHMESDPGDYIGAGQTWDYTPDNITFSLNGNRGFAGVQLSGSTFWNLEFAAPQGAGLDPGSYPDATRWPFQAPDEPGLNVSGDGRGCNQLTGSFQIKRITFGASDQPTSLWAQFEQHCEGGRPALRGDVRINVDIAVEVIAPFGRSTARGQELAFDVSARSATGLPLTLGATGLPAGADFDNHGNGTGTFRWTPGIDQIGRVAVTFTASDGQGGSDASVTTIEVIGETSLTMRGDPGDVLGQNQSYFFTPEVGDFTAFENFDGTVSVRFDAQPLREWNLQFRAAGPFGTDLSPGFYPGARSESFFGDSTHPFLSVSGKGRSCNGGEGAFHVKRLVLGAGNTVESLWIVFSERCAGLDAALHGDVRINADVRIAVSAPLERTLLRGQTVLFEVTGTRADSGAVALSVENAPAGATFVDHGNGNATFGWTPGDVPIDDYDVQFIGEGPTGVRDTALARIRLRGVDALVVDSDEGDPIAGGTDTEFSRADARFRAQRNAAGGVAITAEPRSFSSPAYALDFAAPFNAPLAPGTYPGAIRYPSTDARIPGLFVRQGFFGGDCNVLTGSFVVHEIRYGSGDEIEAFRASFEQQCTGSSGGLRGEVRWNADLPVVVSAPGSVIARRGEPTTFEVSAYVRGGGIATITAPDLPAGATLTDLGNNRAVFAWTPTGSQVGAHRVRFVAQSGGESDQTSTRIEVQFTNHPPVAAAGGPYHGVVGQPVRFDGSGSSDPDGDALNYFWGTGDGGFASGVTPEHVYSTSGAYVLRLEVYDGLSSSVDTATVLVAPLLAARAFVPGESPLRLSSGKPELCIHIEPVAGSFALADVDPGSVGLRYQSGGAWLRIAAIPGSVHAERDRDRNGVAELEACFAKDDLRTLFAGISGTTSLLAVADGQMNDGRGFEATLAVTVMARAPETGFAVRQAPDGRTVEFVTRRSGPLRVELFDLRGRRVEVARDESDAPAGRYSVPLGDAASGRLAPGVYFYRVTSVHGEATGRVFRIGG